MQSPHNILVIRRDNIGDLVCTTPLLSILRARHPKAHLAVLANSYNAAILQGNPDIDAVHIYTKAKHRKNQSLLQIHWQRFQLIRKLRQQKIDLAILATPSLDKNGYRLARQVNAKQIIGIDNGTFKRIHGIDPVNTQGLHQVEQVLVAAGMEPNEISIPPVKVFTSQNEKNWAQLRLQQANCKDNNPIGIHISARKPENRWPTSHYIALINKLIRTTDKPIALFWSPGSQNDAQHPGDDEKAAEIIQQVNNPRLIAFPTKELRQLVAGLSQLSVLLCSDGGAMHIAAGLDCPIVCLFGYAGSQQWRPWAEHTLLHAEPLESLSVNTVHHALIHYG